MPYIVHGNARRVLREAGKKERKYAYPDGLDLKPGSDLHNTILARLVEYAERSHSKQSARYADWRRIDRTLTAYQVVDEEEARVKAKDKRRPVSIVFPYSYAMLETLLTYLVKAFFQDPLFRYEGVTPEDTIGAMLLELDVRVQSVRNRHPLALHTFFRDCLVYGQGIVTPVWEVQRRYKRGKRKFNLPGEPAPRLSAIFEGNTLYNVDPYHYLPDPGVAVHEMQRGEFVGWTRRDSLVNLLQEELEGEGDIFNVAYARESAGLRSVFAMEEDEREAFLGGAMEEYDDKRIDRMYMYVNLVPADWGLGDSEYPEKWLFSVLGDAIIIQAERLNFDHQKYPAVVGAPDFDGYTGSPLSRLEVLYGLQHVLDFLFNSHIANVRKAVNDTLVVDPYLINVADVEDPRPGKVIRMRRPAWGRGVKDAIMQLAVTDITGRNVQDSEWIVQWMQRIAAVDDSSMGVQRSGGPERLTTAEFQGTQGNAVSRLQRIAQILSWQAMQDLGMQIASHTQQFRTQESWVNITGDYQRRLMETFGVQQNFPQRMKITPDDLLIDYDVIPRDGSLPGGNFSSAWLDLFKTVTASPELAAQFDTFRLFSYIAREMGAKNVEEFRAVQTQVMPDQQVAQGVQAGNLIPLQAVGGGA